MADMARRTATPPPPEDFEENIVDIDVAEEMRGSGSQVDLRGPCAKVFVMHGITRHNGGHG